VTWDGAVALLGPDGPTACVVLLAVAAVAVRLLWADGVVPPAATPERATTADLALDKPLTAGRTAPADGSACRSLSTGELCAALRRSYLPSPDSALQSEWSRVTERGYLLDEIERRDPVGFRRWLVSAPEVGEDPGCYLTPGRSNPESPR